MIENASLLKVFKFSGSQNTHVKAQVLNADVKYTENGYGFLV